MRGMLVGSPPGVGKSGCHAHVGFVHCDCVRAPQVAEQDVFAVWCKCLPKELLEHLKGYTDVGQTLKGKVSGMHDADTDKHTLLQQLVE